MLRNECFWGTTNTNCYTASWSLIYNQLIFYISIQFPIVVTAILFEWFHISRFHKIQQLRLLLGSKYIIISNGLLQFIASVYICTVWALRAGFQGVTIENWIVETIFMGFLMVSYVVRFANARNKIHYVLQMHCLMDILAITSHFALSFKGTIHHPRTNQLQTVYSWLDFGFLRSFIVYRIFGRASKYFPYTTFFNQMIILIFRGVCLTFFASSCLLALESLGELSELQSFFFHVYRCEENGIVSVQPNPISQGTCDEGFSVFSAIYYMFVTVSTVGYGDITPKTLLGRLIMCYLIAVGIYTFAQETTSLVAIFQDHRMGKSSYRPDRSNCHVVVTGNPTSGQIKNILREFFHPDHEYEWGEKTPKMILLLNHDNDDMSQVYLTDLRSFINSSRQLKGRVHIFIGSPLSLDDLLRVSIQDAVAVFVLPDKYSIDVNEEDAANALRVLAIRQYAGVSTRIFVMLMNSENFLQLRAAGVRQDETVCVDEIKLGLMGISCRCVGLSTLLANLISSRSSDNLIMGDVWRHEYSIGATKEVYFCTLNQRYWDMTFIEASRAIHVESAGQVLAIGILGHDDRAILNPGTTYRIHSNTKEKTMGMLEFCRSFEPKSTIPSSNKDRHPTNVVNQPTLEEHELQRKMSISLENPFKNHNLIEEGSFRHFPPKRIIEGRHIIICSNYPSSSPSAIARMKSFIAPLRALHVDSIEPIVIVDEDSFPENWWQEMSRYSHIYHVQGSPLVHKVLMKAGIRTATSVVVLGHTTCDGNDDFKTVFNSILVESIIANSKTQPLFEFSDLFSNQYLDPMIENVVQEEKDDEMDRDHATSMDSYLETTKSSKLPPYESSWISKFFSTFYDFLVLSDGDFDSEIAEHDNDLQKLGQDAFYQKRYVGGSLFPASIVGDLLVQSFYNPAIPMFTKGILNGDICVTLYQIPKHLRHHGGLTFGDLFDHMMLSPICALPIGLLRYPTSLNRASHPYVFCSPYRHVLVHPKDQVYVIISVDSLHQAAHKIQKHWLGTKHNNATTST